MHVFRNLEQRHGGVRPRPRHRDPRHLSPDEREEISRGLVDGEGVREIARRIGRAPSTVSREIARNGGPARYRASSADRRAWRCGSRPKPAKLLTEVHLRLLVEGMLAKEKSPRLISLRLKEQHPDNPRLNVSPETIYTSLYVQGKGALRQELHRALRTGRAMRKPHGRTAERAGSRIPNMVLISDRPAEIEDRAVPGHWEGDLIQGSGHSFIGTLVERQTRYVILLKVKDSSALEVSRSMIRQVRKLPAELRKSATWDQGNEMARHQDVTMATGMQIFFCHPASPWERGQNEQTNKLLRQYFPKGSDLTVHSQRHLDKVAQRLNEREREGLDLYSPAELMAGLLR
jgi:IS30 family transposase